MTTDRPAPQDPGWTTWSQERFELGEGSRGLEDGSVVMVDILSGRLLDIDPTSPAEPRVRCVLDVPLGAVAPVTGRPGQWLAAAGTGIAVLTEQPGTRTTVRWLDRPEDGAAQPARMNDGVADPAGRFWAGSMAYAKAAGAGSLYRTDPDGSVTRVLDGLTIPNGPVFDPTGSLMYLAESPQGRIDAFDVDPTSGQLGGRRPFVHVDNGSPDGMVMDDEGFLWVAVHAAGEVHRYSPSGRLDRVLDVPASQPTSLCFGGPGRSRLFLTTATEALEEPHGQDGRLLSVEVGVTGPAARQANPPLG
jgi:sugar lactone lactonase YvrE